MIPVRELYILSWKVIEDGLRKQEDDVGPVKRIDNRLWNVD